MLIKSEDIPDWKGGGGVAWQWEFPVTAGPVNYRNGAEFSKDKGKVPLERGRTSRRPQDGRWIQVQSVLSEECGSLGPECSQRLCWQMSKEVSWYFAPLRPHSGQPEFWASLKWDTERAQRRAFGEISANHLHYRMKEGATDSYLRRLKP